MRRNFAIYLVLFGLVAAACADSSDDTVDAAPAPAISTETETSETETSETETSETAAPVPTPEPTATPSGPRIAADIDPASVPTGEPRDFGPAPEVGTGELAPEAADAIDTLMGERLRRRVIDVLSFEAIETLGASGDARVAWWLAELMWLVREETVSVLATNALQELLGLEFNIFSASSEAVDLLIGWDIPAPPDYLKFKRNVYVAVDPRWEPLFEDDTEIDWRMITWGGVLIDDRPYDRTDVRCNCIPAADNPITTDVAGGDEWLDDDTIVFGVSINGEHRAYPRSIMEVRELVNDTLGGRDFAMPYCTLCGSAQVYFTDEVPEGVERPVMRTSGLLNRSNKVMFDVNTFSIFDTFLGKAVSGPLLEAGVELNQNSVITTTWGAWKTDHPDTTVLDITLAMGNPDSDLRNTRDADGPIFPIGQVDPRLPVQEDVLGVITAEGDPIAFHVKSAIDALERGEFIEVEGITVILDGGGVRAIDADGNDLGGHQAFWFAWSQFYPDTDLWPL